MLDPKLAWALFLGESSHRTNRIASHNSSKHKGFLFHVHQLLGINTPLFSNGGYPVRG